MYIYIHILHTCICSVLTIGAPIPSLSLPPSLFLFFYLSLFSLTNTFARNHTPSHVCAYTHTHFCVYLCMCIRTLAHTRTHTHTHTHIHTYTHVHTHTHVHIYKQIYRIRQFEVAQHTSVPLLRVTPRPCMCAMTHSYVWHDSFLHTYCDVTNLDETVQTRDALVYHPYRMSQVVEGMCTIGWLRLVGASKLYVSFAKEPYKRDDILQKRPTIIRSLLIVATL